MNAYTKALAAHDHQDAFGHKTVRANCVVCSARPAADQRTVPAEPAKLATVPQINFLLSLQSEINEARRELGRGPNATQVTQLGLEEQGVTAKAASGMIDALKIVRDEYRIELRNMPKKPKNDSSVEEGFYVLDQDVYKVQVAVHGNGRKYCKILVVEEGGKGRFVYDASLTRGVMSKLTPAHLLTRETAKALGALYGVCVRCGAILTEDDSIDRMMGPVCWGKTEA